MHNDRRNKRKNDPAATREPSSRVAQATTVPSNAGGAGAGGQFMDAHGQQQYYQQQQQNHHQPRAGSRGGGGGSAGRVARTPTSLQNALAHHGALPSGGLMVDGLHAVIESGYGGQAGGREAKRQRLADGGAGSTDLHTSDSDRLAMHNAMMSMLLAGGGGARGGWSHHGDTASQVCLLPFMCTLQSAPCFAHKQMLIN